MTGCMQITRRQTVNVRGLVAQRCSSTRTVPPRALGYVVAAAQRPAIARSPDAVPAGDGAREPGVAQSQRRRWRVRGDPEQDHHRTDGDAKHT